MIQTLIYYGLSAGILSTLLYFIFKTAVTKSFDFALERYKSDINKELETHKHELQIEVEKFKGDLNITTIEHNISFGKLQEERAIAIKTTYQKLVELSKQLQILTSMFQGPEWHVEREKDKAAELALNDFKEYILINRIYLPKATCEKVLQLVNDSFGVIINMSLAKTEASANNEFNDRSSHALWRELDNQVNTQIKEAMTDLEDHFRKLLGDR